MSPSLLLHLLEFSRQILVFLGNSPKEQEHVQRAIEQQGLTVHIADESACKSAGHCLTWLESILNLRTSPTASVDSRLQQVHKRISQHANTLVIMVHTTAHVPLETWTLLFEIAAHNVSAKGQLRLLTFTDHVVHERLLASELADTYEKLAYVILQDDAEFSGADSAETPANRPSAGKGGATLGRLPTWLGIGLVGAGAIFLTALANMQLEQLETPAATTAPVHLALAESTTTPDAGTETEALPQKQPTLQAEPVTADEPSPEPLPVPEIEEQLVLPEETEVGMPMMTRTPSSSDQPVQLAHNGTRVSPAAPTARAALKASKTDKPARQSPRKHSGKSGEHATPRPKRQGSKSAPAVRQTGTHSAYTVQIAVLKHRAKAIALRRQYPQLKMHTTGVGKDTRYQLYLGPFTEWKAAQHAKKQLATPLLALGPWIKTTNEKTGTALG